jgi:VanZ family protein
VSDPTPRSRPSTGVRRLLLALALAVNLVTMYAPSLPAQVEPAVDLRLDLVGHAASFAALTFTGLLAGVPRRLLVALVAANAIASELIQHLLLPRRTGDVTDLAADAVGIVLGLLAWLAWERFRARRRARPADATSGPRSSSRR